MGKRCRRSLVLTNPHGHALSLDMDPSPSKAEQRAEAVSKLKLLPMPGQIQEKVRNIQYCSLRTLLFLECCAIMIGCMVAKHAFTLVWQVTFDKVIQTAPLCDILGNVKMFLIVHHRM